MKTKVSHYSQKFSIYIVLVALFIVCSMLSPYFLNSNNLINVSRQLSVGILIAYGEMLLIISGFLDLSVGSVLALAGVLSVSTYQQTQSMTAAVLVALVVAVSCNIVNAFFVATCLHLSQHWECSRLPEVLPFIIRTDRISSSLEIL